MLPARNSRRKCSSWCCSSRSAASAPGPPPAAGSASYNTATSAIKYWLVFIFFIGRRRGLELYRKTYQVPNTAKATKTVNTHHFFASIHTHSRHTRGCMSTFSMFHRIATKCATMSLCVRALFELYKKKL